MAALLLPVKLLKSAVPVATCIVVVLTVPYKLTAVVPVRVMSANDAPVPMVPYTFEVPLLENTMLERLELLVSTAGLVKGPPELPVKILGKPAVFWPKNAQA